MVTYVQCGLLFDGRADEPIERATLVLEGELVREVQEGWHGPGSADLLDLREYSVLPGLVDGHDHFGIDMGDGEPEARRQDEHTHEHEQHQTDAHGGPRLQEPARSLRAGRRGDGDPAEMRLWVGTLPGFGVRPPMPKVDETKLVLLALPLQAGELGAHALAFDDPRRRP